MNGFTIHPNWNYVDKDVQNEYQLSKRIIDTIHVLDRCIKFKTPKSFTTYRGIIPRPDYNYNIQQLESTGSFSIRGFLSTSVQLPVAINFAYYDKPNYNTCSVQKPKYTPIIYQITVPKGMPCLPVSFMMNCTNLESTKHSEYEILFPRDCIFKLIRKSIKTFKLDGRFEEVWQNKSAKFMVYEVELSKGPQQSLRSLEFRFSEK